VIALGSAVPIRRHASAALAAVGCFVICAWAASAYRRADTYTTDSSYYQGLADNLASHKGYSFDFKPHTRYPPGFPAMLAVGGAVVGHEYTSYVRLMPLFGFLGLLAMFAIVSREEDERVAAIACLLLAWSPQFFRSITQDVLSDLPYFAASSVALAAGSARRHAVSAAIFVAAAVTIRSAGVALTGAFMLALLWDWRSLPPRTRILYGVAAAAGAVAEISWLAWVFRHASPDWPGEPMDSYLRQLVLKDPRQPGAGMANPADVLWHARDGLAALSAHAVEVVTRLPWVAPSWYSPLVIGPIAAIAAGVWCSLVRHRSVLLDWYVVVYCALFALWPFDEGARFVLPIFPLLVMFAFRGALFWREAIELKPRIASAIRVALVVMAMASLWSMSRQGQTGLQDRLSVLCWMVLAVAALAVPRIARHRIASLAAGYAPVAAGAVVVLLLGFGFVQQMAIAKANRTALSAPPGRMTTLEVADWLRSRHDAGPVMVQQTAVLHRLTGRRTVSFPTTDDGNLIARTIRFHAVAYLVVADDGTDQFYRPLERARFDALTAAVPGCCELAYVNAGYHVYRVGARAGDAQVRSVLQEPGWQMQLNDEMSSASPAVSIITPAYNTARYLEESVESALAQTFADFELLIVDDGSTDETLAIARRLAERDRRVHAFTTEQRVGVSAARNVGFRHARGRFFALLDSDDVWLPEFLAAQLAVFDRAPAADVVSGNAFNLGGPSDGQPLRPPSGETRPITLIDMIEHEDAVLVMSVLRRRVVDVVGGFSEDLRRSEDYDFWLRAALAGIRFVANPIPLVRYRRHASSASSNELLMLDAMIGVLQRLRASPVASHVVVATLDRRIDALNERRLWTSAKAKLMRREYAAAADDLKALAQLRQSLRVRLIAGASRAVPGALRLAYRTKTALRV
jgi:glycosyltransferase involved in cell wall biosynthesis